MPVILIALCKTGSCMTSPAFDFMFQEIIRVVLLTNGGSDSLSGSQNQNQDQRWMIYDLGMLESRESILEEVSRLQQVGF